MKIIERIKRWYEGEYVMYDNKPNSTVYIVGGSQEYSRSAKVARAVVQHLSAEWKYWLGILLAVLALPFLPIQCGSDSIVASTPAAQSSVPAKKDEAGVSVVPTQKQAPKSEGLSPQKSP